MSALNDKLARLESQVKQERAEKEKLQDEIDALKQADSNVRSSAVETVVYAPVKHGKRTRKKGSE